MSKNMSKNIFISPKAKDDLEKIWLYTYENWSKKQADLYYHQIISVFNLLKENPEEGIEVDEIRNGYRRFQIEKHFIFYKIKNTEIQIMRILNQRMNVLNHL